MTSTIWDWNSLWGILFSLIFIFLVMTTYLQRFVSGIAIMYAHSNCVHPSFFCGVLLCTLTFRVPHFDVRYDFRIKPMFDLYWPPVVCWGYHVLLNYVICVCFRIVVSNKYCIVFSVFFSFFVLLPVSLDCSFLIMIALSVFL